LATVGKLYNDGSLEISGEFNERLPAITSGLIAHFPLDGKGGTFDVVGGHQPVENTLKGLNLINAMALDWRDPKSWQFINGSEANMSWDASKQAIKVVGSNYAWLKTPLTVDVNKHYLITAEIYQETASATNVLYFGGHGLTQTGVKYTTNYDYSISSNYNVPEGSWKTIGANRYGITNDGGIGGNGAGDITIGPIGWTGPNGLCYKYYLGGLFNYSGSATDVIYIRNIKIEIIDNDNYMCKIDNDGIFVEENTVNLYPGPSDAGRYLTRAYDGVNYGFGSATNIQTQIDNPINPCPVNGHVQRISRILPNISNLTYVEWTSIIARSGATFLPNEERILSFYYFGTYGTSIQMYLGGGIGNIQLSSTIATSGNNSKSISIPVDINMWNKISIRLKNVDITNSTFAWGWMVLHNNMEISAPGAHECWKFCGVQVEQKPYATSYVVGSRSVSELNLPVNLSNADFTIVGQMFRQRPIDSTIVSNACDLYLSGNNICSLRYYLLGGTPSPWIDADSWGQPHNYISKSFNYNKWSWFYIQRVGNTKLTFSLLNDDGNTWTTWQVIPTSAQYFTSLILKTGTNSKFKNISFYNTVLSLVNIDKMRDNKSPISKVGSITGMSLVERSITIPGGAYHFPLDINSKEKNTGVGANEDANTVYDGSVWVGNAVSNLATNEFVYWDNTGTSQVVSDELLALYPGTPVHGLKKLIAGGTGIRATSTSGSLLPLTKYSVSAYVWIDVPMTQGGPIYLREATTAVTSGYSKGNMLYKGKDLPLNLLPQKRWIKLEGTATSDSDILYVSICTYLNDAGGKFFITKPHFTQAPFNSPFTKTTRAASSLEYNLNRDLNLDWSQDWTICYKKKSIGTNDGTLNAYSMESLGVSNNTNIGNLWWGKNINDNSFYCGYIPTGLPQQRVSATSTPPVYHNTWMLVYITKNGNILNIKQIINGITYSVTMDATSINTPNHFVAPTLGYDLNLGGRDNGSPCNAYYKDLIVAKKYLSDSEIQDIYNKPMSVSKCNITLKNDLCVNVIL
jgi:hypothetical protein